MENKNQNQEKNNIQNGSHSKNGSTIGQKAADEITRMLGSWSFIIVQTALLLVWVLLNIIAWSFYWDPYPFILLNLVLSFQAAFTAPIILMSQNRMSEKDRRKAEADLATDRKAEREIRLIQEKLEELDRKKLDKILEILKSKNGS